MKADAILTSDWHIWDDTPVCRLDDYMKTQERKYDFIRELQNLNGGCPILLAGDLFNHWKPKPVLLSWALRVLPDHIICIPGQHDLPNHVLSNMYKSGIEVLREAGKIEVLGSEEGALVKGLSIEGFPFGEQLTSYQNNDDEKVRKIALIHHLVYEAKEPFPGAAKVGGNAKSIINKMKGFDLIVSGDNHQSFTVKVGDTLLVNPGPIMRTTAAQIDYKPRVYLYYAKTNTVEPVYIPINKRAVTRGHLTTKEERDERLTSFVERLKKDVEVGISFKDNMKKTLAKNRIDSEIKDIVWECIP